MWGWAGGLIESIAAVVMRVSVSRQHCQHLVVDEQGLVERPRVLQGETEVARDRELVLRRQSCCNRGSVGSYSLNPPASGLVAEAALNWLKPCGLLRVGGDEHADEQRTRAHRRPHESSRQCCRCL